MKVLLANPQAELANDLGLTVLRDRGFGEHLGIRYLASVLEQDGHRVDLIDRHFERLDQEQFLSACSAGGYDLCGISFVEPQLDEAVELAQLMRRTNPGAVLLIGGYGATFLGVEALRRAPEIDAAVLGEGELTLRRLVARIQAKEPWRQIPGLLWLEAGREVSTGRPELVEDLDTLPWPRRGKPEQYGDRANILASRGCHGRCSYCSITESYRRAVGSPVRIRRPEAVIDEMEHVHRTLGVRHFDFLDDNFTAAARIDRSWAEKFVAEILQRGMQVSWGVQARATDVSEDLFRLLHSGGLRIVSLGIETDVPRVLKLFRKGGSREANRRAVQILRGLSMHMYIEMILLEPTTTLPEVRQNLAFLREIDITQSYRQPPVTTSRRLNLFHGLPITEEMQRLGVVQSHGWRLDYQFVDKRVERLDSVLERWQRACANTTRLHNDYLHYRASAAHQLKVSLDAVKTARDYLSYDLAFLERAVDLVDERPNATEAELDAFVEQHLEPVMALQERFLRIKDRVQ